MACEPENTAFPLTMEGYFLAIQSLKLVWWGKQTCKVQRHNTQDTLLNYEVCWLSLSNDFKRSNPDITRHDIINSINKAANAKIKRPLILYYSLSSFSGTGTGILC